MILESIILALLAVLTYAWIGYPVLLALAATFKERRADHSPTGDETPPAHPLRVTVLIAAHNEEDVIRGRLENLVAASVGCSEFGVQIVHVHVGTDGCSDRTARIAREFAKDHPNIHIHEFLENRGKTTVLKDLVQIAERVPELQGCRVAEREEGSPQRQRDTRNEKRETRNEKRETSNEQRATRRDLLVFTDANTMFDEQAMGRLLAPFSDPKVGGVCGRLVFVEKEDVSRRSPERGRRERIECADKDGRISNIELPISNDQHHARLRPSATAWHAAHSPAPEGAYWEWETRLKTAESTLDSCLGANGAIYAIRANLFPADIPDNTVVDDFVIGMKVRERGFRMVYEPAAVAYEEPAPGMDDEWTRRVRIGAGDFQALGLCRRCLSPRFGAFAWMFWSHKVLRWFTPHILLLLLVTGCLSLVLGMEGRDGGMAERWRIGVPGAALILLALAGTGRILRLAGTRWGRIFHLCDHFVTMQAALFAGFLRYCMGGLSGRWKRTPRRAEGG